MNRRAFIIGLSAFAAPPAVAHGWYEPACCSGRDCEPLPPEAVEDMGDGWRVHYVAKSGFTVNEFVPLGKQRPSQDGRFHGCASKVRFLCLYVPSTV